MPTCLGLGYQVPASFDLVLAILGTFVGVIGMAFSLGNRDGAGATLGAVDIVVGGATMYVTNQKNSAC